MKRILPLLFLLPALAAAVDAPRPETLAAREAFAQEGFGIFVHWGVYAVWGKGEWYLAKSGMPLAQYEAKTAEFNPTNFDARAWAKAFKGAGARYVTITSRHHDGFSMFDTAQTDYDIVDATPFGRDPLKELSQACAEEGLNLGFYYSLLDWRRPDYPRGSATDDYDSYFAFMTNQVAELLTGYGPVHCIWFDGEWDHNRTTGFDWRLGDFYDHIHRLQPSCLVGNNSHENLLEGEDFQVWEVNYPGGHSGAMNPHQTEIATNVPLECCWSTTDDAWGYNPDDAFEKMTYPEIVRRLVRTHAKGANLLLNVGPAPDGTIPPTVLERLAAVGDWIDDWGHTVFGTVPSPYAVMDTVATESADGKTVWLHSMPDSANANYGMWMAAYHTVVRATDLMTGKPLAFTQKPSGDKSMLSMTLRIPDGVPDYIVKLDVEPLQAQGDPAVEIVGIEPGTTNAEVCAFLRGTGGQTWGSLSAEYSTSPDFAGSQTVRLAAISGPGGLPCTLSGLEPATQYWIRLRLAAGNLPEAVSEAGSFTTLSTKAPPALGAAAVSTTKTNATLVVPVASLGDDGASVTVTATLGGATKTATLSAPGEATFVFEGLAADTEYAWSVSAVAAPSGLAAAPQSGVATTKGVPKETKGWFFVDLSDEGYVAFPDVSGVAAPGGAWSGAEDFELAYSGPAPRSAPSASAARAPSAPSAAPTSRSWRSSRSGARPSPAAARPPASTRAGTSSSRSGRWSPGCTTRRSSRRPWAAPTPRRRTPSSPTARRAPSRSRPATRRRSS